MKAHINLILLLAIMLAVPTQGGRIMPDLDNPITFSSNDANWNGTSMMVSFELPRFSQGIPIGGYIAVDFTNSDDGGSAFAFTNTNFDCALHDMNGNSITVANGNTGSSTVAYCRITETRKSLKLVAMQKYTLTLNTKFTSSVKTLSQVGVYTTTSNTAAGTKIDSNVVFGSVHLFNSFSGSFTNPLSFLSNSTDEIKVTAGTSTTAQAGGNEVFIKDTFYVNLSVEVKKRIPKDYDYVFTYNPTYFSDPQSIETLDFTNGTSEDLQKKLSGNLTLEKVSAGMMRIKGIDEDLLTGRKFQLRFSGFGALKETPAAQPLSLIVYYRNQNTVYSMTTNNDRMAVQPLKMTNVALTSSSGLKWVVEDYTYPVDITFQPNVDLEKVYVKITHTSSATKYIGFNAASCEFTGDAFLADFGKAPVCHSIGKGTDSSNGFHYYLENLKKDEVHKVKVLAHFSVCGDERNIATTDGSKVTSSKFTVKIEVFQDGSNSAGLTNLLATASTTESAFSCGVNSNLVYQPHNEKLTFTTEEAGFEYMMGTEVNGLSLYSVVPDTDVYVWNMQSGGGDITGYDGLTANIAASASKVYINSSNTATKLADGSLVTIVADRNLTGAKSFEMWPTDKLLNDSTTLTQTLTGHYLEINYDKKWFKVNNYNSNSADVKFNNLCYTAWGIKADTEFDFSADLAMDSLTPTEENKNAKVLALPAAGATRKYIFESGDAEKANISTDSVLSDTVENRYVIKGKVSDDGTTSRYSFPCGGDCSGTGQRYFGLFTTCVKWNLVQTTKTIFDSVDINIYFNKADGDRPRRWLRLLSYVGMSGIFAPVTLNTNYDETQNIDYHMVGDVSTNNTTICVLKVPASNYSRGDFAGNAYIVFMYNIQLLETDYTSYDNQYPIGGTLNGGVSVYGYSTALPVSSTGYRTIKRTYGDVSNEYKKNETSDTYVLTSQVWFTGLTTNIITLDETNAGDIYIPHYCSQVATAADTTSNFAVGIWFDAANTKKVTQVTKKFASSTGNLFDRAMKSNGSQLGETKDKYFFLRMNYAAFNTDVKRITASPTQHRKETGSIVTTYGDFNYIQVLLSEKIGLDSNFSISNLGTNTAMRSKDVPFYFMGHRYNKYILGFFSANIQLYGVDNTVSTAFYLEGVHKPSLDSIVDSEGNLTLANNIVFAGGSATNTTGVVSKAATNLYEKSAWVSVTAGSYTWDVSYVNNDTVFYENVAKISINIKNRTNADLLNKVVFPAKSPMIIEFNQGYTAGAFCAIDQVYPANDQRYARECTYNGTNRYTCRSEFATGQFNLCCFNLSFSNTTTSFGLTNLLVDYGTSAADYYSYNVFDQRSFGDALSFTTTTIPVPKVTNYNFALSKTVGGVSDLMLTVDLVKPLDYDAVYEITGKFSDTLLYSMVPKCSAGTTLFGYPRSWGTGDEIIDSCSIENFSTDSGIIKVTTKKFVSNCNQKNATKLYIVLTPVKVASLSEIDLKMTVKRATGGATIIQDSTTGVKPTGSVTVVDPAPTVADDVSATTLCNLKTVYPAIVGAKATLTYEIDYTSSIEALNAEANFPNEVFIYMDPMHFGSYEGATVTCGSNLPGVTDLDCYIYRNFILLNFKNISLKTTTNKFEVYVYNITLPKIGADSYSYPCSLNHLPATEVRKVIVVGRGKYEGSVGTGASNKGVLSFDNSAGTNSTSFNPRAEQLSLDFGLIVDEAGSHSRTDLNISNTPVIIFEFPSNYTNSKYANSSAATQVTAEVKQTRRNTESATFATLPEETIASGNAAAFGNSFQVALNPTTTGDNASFTLRADLVYMSVKLNGVQGPEEEESSGGLMNVYITNSDYSVLYRTYSNTNNQYSIAKEGVTSIIRFYRGFSFSYDRKNWVLNINNDEENAQPNIVRLDTGFYTPVKMYLEHFDNLNAFSGKVTVSFTLPFEYFMTIDGEEATEKKVTLNSVDNSQVFKLGIACNVAPGRYLVKVNTELEENAPRKFVPEAFIYFFVYHTTKQIDCQVPSIVIPKDSRAQFSCVTPADVVGDYNLTFTNANTADSFSAATVTTRNILNFKRATFSTLFTANRDTTTQITMEATTNNSCLAFPQGTKGTYVFRLGDDLIPELKDSDLDDFTFSNREDDVTLKWNEILLSYNIPQYAELSCVITCANLEFPTDSEIKDQTSLKKSKQLAFFTVYSTARGFTQSAKFDGLKRQNDYKIRCVLQSGSSAANAPEFEKTYTLLNKHTNQTVDFPIRLPDTLPTHCAHVSLSKAAVQDTKQRMVDLCQNLFSTNEGIASGCITCTDIDQNIFAVGISLTSLECVATQTATTLRNLQKKSLRFLQDTTTDNTNTDTTTDNTDTTTDNTNTDTTTDNTNTDTTTDNTNTDTTTDNTNTDTTTDNTNTDTTTDTTTENSITDNGTDPVFQQYIHYTVCAVQDVFCTTPQLTEANMDEQFAKFYSSIDSKDEINNTIYANKEGVSEVPTIEYVNSQSVKDKDLPTLKICTDTTPEEEKTEGCIKVESGSIEFNGAVSTKAMFSSNLSCHWNSLIKLDTLPTQAEVASCTNKRCGSFVTYKDESVTFRAAAATRFSDDREFAVYVTCKAINVLNARKTSTQVIELHSKKFQIQTKSCPKPQKNLTPDSDQCTCLDANNAIIDQGETGELCSSAWIQLAFLMFAFVLLI